MDLEQFAGISHLNDDYYDVIVKKLGGIKAVKPYIPFSLQKLRESYAEDKFFNTSLTPLRAWDNATGISVPTGQGLYRQPAKNSGLWPLFYKHGITSASLSEAVCILKTAARMQVEHKGKA